MLGSLPLEWVSCISPPGFIAKRLTDRVITAPSHGQLTHHHGVLDFKEEHIKLVQDLSLLADFDTYIRTHLLVFWA